MISLYQNVLDPEFRKPFGNVNRWFTTIVNQPQVKKVVGAVVLAEKMAQFDAAKFAELQKASGGGDSGKNDKKNFSIWRCDYKYNDELAMVFMSCNLMGGMYQRLEKLRKNAFASMALFGENNNSTISGIWVWKGHDLAFE